MFFGSDLVRGPSMGSVRTQLAAHRRENRALGGGEGLLLERLPGFWRNAESRGRLTSAHSACGSSPPKVDSGEWPLLVASDTQQTDFDTISCVARTSRSSEFRRRKLRVLVHGITYT